jgi:3-methyladenine DNA glycosylase AlkD
MRFQEAFKALEAAGSEQTRKTLARHGVSGPMFGVSYAVLKDLVKKIKKDHTLAEQLWATGNHDARILATMVADPAALTGKQIDQWVKAVDNRVITEALAGLVARTAHAQARADKWTPAASESLGCAGWALVAHLAASPDQLPDAYFQDLLEVIEREIHTRKNFVRHAMNMALINIGIRNEKLTDKALAAAAKIGKVEVDHGNTSCKTPDAAAYIHKTLEHRKKKGKTKKGC